MDLGYARVSTPKEDPTRHPNSLSATGVDHARIHVDKTSGVTTARAGLPAVAAYARDGVVPTEISPGVHGGIPAGDGSMGR
ncbi:recombinase family protein [Pseudarthrobacter sp. N5]|uniref:recombinase family protein n=1 Tax=Pseudarthrobacter sp. N5 TaxID=3418416 RepID=UPI003CF29161